ncbi:MAG: hypothetical protein H7Z43_02380 [Clostridia bacterium]|nr:hypothetical protein [Deltaproteobacteria bacterium]
MSKSYEEVKKKAGALKGKAKKARTEGKKVVAKAFKKGARKLARRLKGITKPIVTKIEEAAS